MNSGESVSAAAIGGADTPGSRLRWTGWVFTSACFVLLAFAPRLGNDYTTALLINLLLYGVLATAWGLFCGTTRYISLATVAFFGAGSYTVAVLGEQLSWPLVLLAAAVIGALLALLVGLVTLRLSGTYFVIFTFGLTELLRQVVTWYESKVTGSIGRYVFVDAATPGFIYGQLLALFALVLLLGWWLSRSRLGFALRLIGEDEQAARHCGIDATRTKLVAFTLTSVFMVIAGAIVAPRWTYIDPAIAFNPIVSFQVLIMALLGGAARFWGPVLGVVPLVLLFETLVKYFPNHFSIVLGIIFLLIVYAVPRGIVGQVLERGKRLRRAGAAQ
ncbi:MAG: branched-chain amino acid ABC transporter permease [Burkholderiaceae bacterium]|jgi:branched-chain amino acid transport system permease protein|nr:branched-chain amino acid ABC transporter permease [Burkholderiaceae bacterium]